MSKLIRVSKINDKSFNKLQDFGYVIAFSTVTVTPEMPAKAGPSIEIINIKRERRFCTQCLRFRCSHNY